MADSLFRQLQSDAFRAGVSPRTQEARTWFRKKVKELGEINRNKLLKDPLLDPRKRFRAGSMFMYFYDPKHRETLPYYDSFPLTIMIEPAKNGFYGLNLHYLSPMVRARFLDKLLETSNNNKFDETTRLKLKYEMLKGVKKFKEFQPCFKYYLTDHVESKIVLVEPPEWEIAIFLPTEQFRKKNKTHVWGASKRMIA
jgi:hypothetical protein